ncbi:MAG: hypothetical protein ACJ72N_16845 [Labedaea sp.]
MSTVEAAIADVFTCADFLAEQQPAIHAAIGKAARLAVDHLRKETA